MNNESTIKKIEKFKEKKKTDKIVHYLKSEDDEIVMEAMKALSQVGDETSLNQIIPMIDHEKPVIRKAAASALGALGTEYAKTYLQHRMAKEQDAQVKEAITEALHTISNKK